MSKKINIKPTEAELEILQILWEYGESTVREVNELLNEKRSAGQKEIGYTTTLKLMQLMHEKGLASRNEEKRTHIYRAEVRESDMQKALLDKFVDKTFRGAAMKMVMQTLGNHKTSQQELDEIKALIAKIENKK
ncbi:MAG TPA: BlaI/MecI/CopY family transcriptional regulator [Phaeodactylibacter sp.]|nr:BlaI/MecI/CopY family transcriptional regulator [Phaeodactylibacter sp.]